MVTSTQRRRGMQRSWPRFASIISRRPVHATKQGPWGSACRVHPTTGQDASIHLCEETEPRAGGRVVSWRAPARGHLAAAGAAALASLRRGVGPMDAGRRSCVGPTAQTPWPSRGPRGDSRLALPFAKPLGLRSAASAVPVPCFGRPPLRRSRQPPLHVSRAAVAHPACPEARLPSSLSSSLAPTLLLPRTYMSIPPNHGLVAQCTTTVLCHLRSAPLWIIVLVVFVFGALRSRLAPLFGRNPRPPAPAAGSAHKRTA